MIRLKRNTIVMKKAMNLKMRVLATLVVGWVALSSVEAADMVRYQGSPRGSSVKIDGTSTVHDWTVEGKLIGGYMEVDGSFPADLNVATVPALPALPKVMVQIPVRCTRR